MIEASLMCSPVPSCEAPGFPRLGAFGAAALEMTAHGVVILTDGIGCFGFFFLLLLSWEIGSFFYYDCAGSLSISISL